MDHNVTPLPGSLDPIEVISAEDCAGEVIEATREEVAEVHRCMASLKRSSDSSYRLTRDLTSEARAARGDAAIMRTSWDLPRVNPPS